MLVFAVGTALLVALVFAAKHAIGRLGGNRKKELVNRYFNGFFAGAQKLEIIPMTPGFDRNCYADYPQLRVLEEHYEVIRRECGELLRIKDDLVPMEALIGGYSDGVVIQADWKTFMFKSNQFIEENCARAPRTANLLRSIPDVCTAFFSVLEPKQRIKPHWGYYKGFVRYHLGVMIPYDNANGECYIRVNSDPEVNRKLQMDRIAEGETYYWKNGEGVMFDDTYLHDAFNESDRIRVVLFVDVRRKMPFALQLLNRIMIFIAYRDKALRDIQHKAIVKSGPR